MNTYMFNAQEATAHSTGLEQGYAAGRKAERERMLKFAGWYDEEDNLPNDNGNSKNASEWFEYWQENVEGK